MKSSRKQRTVSEFGQFLSDPVLFARFMLQQDIWPKQEEILQSIAMYPRTAVKACHASGKTFSSAAAVLWWITTQPNAIAVTTAPTWMQVERLIWGEIHKLVQCARIGYPKPAAYSLHLPDGRYATGLATNEGVRFQGFHGNVLIIMDEAPGVSPDIYEAVHGISAGGDVRVLSLGNPTRSSGPFYDAFTSSREIWNLITISAFDTPNLEGLTLESLLALPEEELEKNPRPYLTTRRWVKERSLEWGPGHQLWDSRVMGNFPLQSEDALFSLTWLEEAKARDEGEGDVFGGLDVGGPGEDETVLCLRRGNRIIALKCWSADDPRGAVVAALAPHKHEIKGVIMDAVGIGDGMAKHLRDLGFPVVPVNVGNTAREKDRFANLKAEIYWQLRERFQKGQVAGLKDDKAIAQLVGIRYFQNPRGQVAIESKEAARKRGVKSPDRAEAIILAFADIRQTGHNVMEYYRAVLAGEL